MPETLSPQDAARLVENADERRMFNESAAVLGGPLAYIQGALAMWHKMDTGGGSYGKVLAIFSNEVAAAKVALDAAHAEVTRLTEHLVKIADGRYFGNPLQAMAAVALQKDRRLRAPTGDAMSVEDAARLSKLRHDHAPGTPIDPTCDICFLSMLLREREMELARLHARRERREYVRQQDTGAA